jgi:uncharacterized protein (DUF1697 family)
MPRYVAFLRAINVGGHVVKMQRLKQLFESLGLEEVETFIASGNVMFKSNGGSGALERKIEQLLERELGYEVKTFIRTDAELAAIGAQQAFDEPVPERATVYIGFLKAAPEGEAEKSLLELQGLADDLRIIGREVYWRCRVPSQESSLSAATLEKALGTPMTLRNANTVRRLLAKYSPSQERSSRSGRDRRDRCATET